MKNKGEKVLSCLFPFLVVGLFILGAVSVLKDTVLPSMETVRILVGLFPFFTLSILLNCLSKKKFLHLLPFLFCIGCCIFRFSNLMQGISEISDRLRAVLSSTEESLPLPPADGKALSDTVHTLFYLLIALSGYSVAAKGSAFGLLVSEFPFFLLILLFPHSIQLVSALCLLFSAVFMLLFVINRNIATTSDTGKVIRDTEELFENKPYSVVFSAIPVLLLTVVCLMLLFGRQENYTESLSAKRFRQTMQQTDLFETFLPYNRGLDNGSFHDKKDLAYSGETALRVKCEPEPDFLYLNGYSGAIYTKSGWKDVPKQEYAALEKNMNGIDPRNLRALYNELSSSADSPSSLTVCREYCDGSVFYLPNGLKTELSSIPDAEVTSDARVQTKFLHKVWEYTLEAYPRNHRLKSKLSVGGMDAESIYSAYTNASVHALQKVSGSAGSVSSDRFSDAAKSYTAFVLDTYTQLPEETHQNAVSLLNRLGLSLSGSSLDLYKTVNSVRKVLNQQLQYTMNKVNIPSSSDFTSTLLLSEKEGSYKHFATAACVLLRAMHIPCRYAEGYIVLKEDYENTDDSGFTPVQDNHARAWIELYDPYLFDWIPFDLSFQADGDGGSEPDEETEESQSGTDGQTEESEDSDTPENMPADSEENEENELPEQGNEDNTPHGTENVPASGENGNAESNPDDTAGSDSGTGNSPEENEIPDPQESELPEEQLSKNTSAPVFPWWIFLLLLPVAVHFALYGYRKYRLEKDTPYNALFFASGLYLKMMHMAAGERYLASDSPVSYLERCQSANPSKEDLLFLERVQAVRFGEVQQNDTDRKRSNALLLSRYRHILSILPFIKKILFFYLYRM